MIINTILFDLDGTLVDSNELILESFRQTFLAYQPNVYYSKSQLLEMMGPPLHKTFQVISTDEKVIQEMIQFYRNTYVKLEFDYISLYPGTIEMLDYFHKNGYNLAIVTTKFLESAYPSINTFHINDYIDVVIGLDDVVNHKPHKEPVMKALSKFSNVLQAIMIGDNQTDIEAGHNAGILTCGLEWSFKKTALKESNPTFWIHHFQELITLIDKYNKEES